MKQTHTFKRRSLLSGAAAALLLLTVATGCFNGKSNDSASSAKPGVQKGTVFYEIFVRAFADSNGDGIGDLKGAASKLDYLKDLGVGGIWLMPITASPSYHGYDVTDYYKVNPEYGTMDDLKTFLQEAHKRNIKVIMDLVVNHTSSQHPWFAASATGKDSKYRSWYTWAEDTGTQMKTDGATGSNPWHPLAGSHYLGVFWEGMPDLNFDNPDVRAEIVKVGQFWLQQGMDGFRLDAAKHIYGDFKSTEHSPDTIKKNQDWWKQFREGMNTVNKDAYIVGEVWDSPTIVAPYLDKFQSAFDFDLAKKIIDTAKSERASDIAFWLSRIYELYAKTGGDTYADATFLSNHDQDRVMTQLGGDVNHAKTAAAILLTLPGNPFVYYGEEIGMKGAKPDEYIREPFIWSAGGKVDPAQTRWVASRFNKDNPPSVEAELKDTTSLLQTYKTLIAWRNAESVLREGAIREYDAGSKDVLAYIRETSKEKALVFHNLTGKPVTLDVSKTPGAAKDAFAKLARTTSKDSKLDKKQLTIAPYSSVLLK